MAEIKDLSLGIKVTRCTECDRVEVVRCKDCENYKQSKYLPDDEMVCMCWSDWLYTDPDDFCSYGERKEK